MTYYEVAYKYKRFPYYRDIDYKYQSLESAKRRARREFESDSYIESIMVTRVQDDVLFARMAKYEREVTA